MDFLFNMPIITPMLGFIMRLCYSLTGNVGIAIMVFTLIVRLAMFPLSVKQQKNTSKTQIFSPRLQEIQQKYRGNTQRMQEEMAKLQKEGYNPAAGCLTMIPTMLILFGVLGVVYKPMTYFEHIGKEQIEEIRVIAREIERNAEYDKRVEEFMATYAPATTDTEVTEAAETPEATETAETAEETADETLVAKLAEIRKDVENDKAINMRFDRIQVELEIIRVFKNNRDEFKEISEDDYKVMTVLEKRIVLWGIDFSELPDTKWPMILIPILAFAFAAGQTVIMQYIQRKTSPDSVKQMGAMRYMFYFMPIMSLVIAFQFPAGAGFYWAISGAVGIVQSVVIYKIWPPDKLRAEVEESLAKRGLNVEKVVVIEKHDGKKVEKKVSEMSGKEEKEYYRKKLEAARKSDLEKYGEVGKSPVVEAKAEKVEDVAQDKSENADEVAEIGNKSESDEKK